MGDEIIRVRSIGQLHEHLGLEKPKHPLVSLVDTAVMEVTEDQIGKKIM